VLNSDRSTVKHAPQNTQNIGFLTALECTKCFRPGLRPGSRWGNLQQSLDPSCFKGIEGTGGEGGEGKERGGEGRQRRREGEETAP